MVCGRYDQYYKYIERQGWGANHKHPRPRLPGLATAATTSELSAGESEALAAVASVVTDDHKPNIGRAVWGDLTWDRNPDEKARTESAR